MSTPQPSAAGDDPVSDDEIDAQMLDRLLAIPSDSYVAPLVPVMRRLFARMLRAESVGRELMLRLDAPGLFTFTADELDLLQSAIAGDIADFLIRADHRGIDPSKNEKYQALLALGRKLGMVL